MSNKAKIMQTFGSQWTEANQQSSATPLKELAPAARSSLLADIVLLSALAVAAAAFRSFVRVPLRVPSHSVLQWLPVVILGQLWVCRWWSGLYQGLLIGIFCCFHPGRIMFSFGFLSLFSEYILAGGLISWIHYRFGLPTHWGWKIWLICPIAGLIANLGRLCFRFAYFLPGPERVAQFYGLIQFVAFYLIFGLASGLVAATIYSIFSRESKNRPVLNERGDESYNES